jgi:hypothetical protein
MNLQIPMEKAQVYFQYARERQAMFRKRERGEQPPWTDDPVMGNIYLCNLFREQDKTTVWFRENVREPHSQDPIRAFAYTILFRWFNRISTGEVMFNDTDIAEDWLNQLLKGKSPHEVGEWMSGRIERECARPYFTGAYMIKADNWMVKHLSISIASSKVVAAYLERTKAEGRFVLYDTLEGWTRWLTGFHGLGWFMAYEAVSDLRWTCLGQDSTDIMSWANVGPGCARGLSRIYHDNIWSATRFRKDAAASLKVMRWLLELSRDEQFWPQDERPWEMREVEHWLCEFDKIERVRKNEGRSKRKYVPIQVVQHRGDLHDNRARLPSHP